jgi:hypothetical protein
MFEERRGLRFPFTAPAEISQESATSESIPGRVVELSLRGCYVEVPILLDEQQRLLVKIFRGGEYFESPCEVLYVRTSGAALVFNNTNPHFRGVLQNWILAALDRRGVS